MSCQQHEEVSGIAIQSANSSSNRGPSLSLSLSSLQSNSPSGSDEQALFRHVLVSNKVAIHGPRGITMKLWGVAYEMDERSAWLVLHMGSRLGQDLKESRGGHISQIDYHQSPETLYIQPHNTGDDEQ